MTFAYNSSTGLLQLSNSSSQHASREFQTSTLGTRAFKRVATGRAETFITTSAGSPPPPPAPVVTSITTSGTGISSGSGDLGIGKVVTFTVNFSQAVTVNTSGGTPTLSLNDNGTASYVGGSGNTALTFNYTVAAGQNASDLTVSSFDTNGATVQNGTTAANLSGGTNYNPTGTLQIDTTAPVVTITKCRRAPPIRRRRRSPERWIWPMRARP